jgi:hypothetical protein
MAALFVPLFHSDGQIGIGKERACRLGLPCPSWKPYNIRSFLFTPSKVEGFAQKF